MSSDYHAPGNDGVRLSATITTLAELGQRHGLSAERIRQKEANALRRLRAAAKGGNN